MIASSASGGRKPPDVAGASGACAPLAASLRFLRPQHVRHAAQVAQVAHRLPGGQAPGDLDDRLFAHAVDEQVGLAVEQDGTANRVAPVVVMGQPAQRRLDAAGDDRHAGKRLARPVAVRQRRPVGTQADPAARRIGVVVADLFVRRVVVDERVHVAGADGEEQPRPAELPPRLARTPVGLRQHRDAEARGLQHARQRVAWRSWGDRRRRRR